MATALDGLVSGLDTTSLIKSLMQVEAAPQALLKTKQTKTQSLVTALQALNTKIAALTETSTKATTAAAWKAVTATSTSTGATATTSATAQPGTLSLTVDAIATTQVSVSRSTADDSTLVPSLPPAVTVKRPDGSYVTVSPTSGSLADIANAINQAADAGVRATVVRVSTGDSAEYRLQFTGTITGQAGAFEVYGGTTAEVQAAVAGGTQASLRLDGTTVRTATDAKVTLWKGVAGLETTFQQSSNTFAGLLTGVDVTVSAVTPADQPPVTITVAQDTAAVTALAKNVVDGLGLVLSEIASRTKTSTTTDADGRTIVTGGLFSGDSGVRRLREQLLSAGSLPVDDVSPSTVGIVIGRDGTFTFDEAVFKAALAKDPAGVQSFVSTLAGRVAEVGKAASDATTGTLTQQITGQQRLVKDYTTQIESWDRRLELRQATLEKTYSALEVQLSNLNAQSSWLTSQLESLSTSTGSK